MQPTMRTRTVGLAGICCGVGLLLANLSWAQQRENDPAARNRQRGQQHQTGEKTICLATDLIGMNVKAKGEEDAGQIQNLVINHQGEVQYLAIAAGGQAQATSDQRRQPNAQQPRVEPAQTIAGGQKLTLIPWDMAKFHEGATAEQKYVSLDVEKDRLAQAPSFTTQQLMSPQGQTQLTAQVDQFFNVRQRRGAARPELDRERNQPNAPDRGTPQPQRQNN